MDLKLYRIEDGAITSVAATSPARAVEALCAAMGCSLAEYRDDYLPDAEITEESRESAEQRWVRDECGRLTTRTVWDEFQAAAAAGEERALCSTEWP